MRDRPTAVRYNHAMADPPPYLDIVLDDLDELFVAPVADPFAGHVEYLCGVDRAIADLRSRKGTDPVPIRLSLPAEEIREDTVTRVREALIRCCDHHIDANRRDRHAARRDGWGSLRIGLPITILGFLLIAMSSEANVGEQEVDDVLLEHLGWVIAWVGLWFPVDQIAFGPLSFGRDNRAWRRLRDAEVTVVARSRTLGDRLRRRAPRSVGEVRGLVEGLQHGTALHGDAGDRRRREEHPPRDLVADAERPGHRRLDRRHVRHHDDVTGRAPRPPAPRATRAHPRAQRRPATRRPAGRSRDRSASSPTVAGGTSTSGVPSRSP